MAANGRQATAVHSLALRGARLTSSTPLTGLNFAPTTLAKLAARMPNADAGEAQIYLRALVGDMMDFVRFTVRPMLRKDEASPWLCLKINSLEQLWIVDNQAMFVQRKFSLKLATVQALEQIKPFPKP